MSTVNVRCAGEAEMRGDDPRMLAMTPALR
jgi:hypothetical protein